jgi:transglutaminase-like putative cysteine protease
LIKKPSTRSVENGYYLALVEWQLDVERKASYHHNIREIVSEAGIQNGSQISISFDPAYERLDFHQITVWRDGKPQNRLNIGDFKLLADEEDFSKFIYQGSYSANYIIPDIRKGDRIEYAFTITGRNPVFNGKFCEDIYLQQPQIIAHEFISMQVSAQRKLNFKYFNKTIKPKIATASGLTHYTWDDTMVQPAADDNSTPGWFTNYNHVQISEYNNWGEVIDWAMKVNPISTNITGELAERIAKLKKDAGGDKEKYFRAAVKTVQDEVRYMGIEIGEYSHRANHPENVFKQRYGDCKDKSLLLASMLRADGIEANMVLVNTNMEDRVDQLMPTTDAFNHAVVKAILNGKQVWVDATIAYQRGKGANLYFPNYGKGLELKAGNKDLVEIPATPIGKVICKEKYTVSEAGKKVRLDVSTTYTLNQADDVRSRLAETGLYTSEKNYLKYYAKIYPKITSRDSLIVKDDEDKNELTTTESYLIPGFFKKDSVSGKYEAGFYADCIDNELPNINSRTSPINLDYPYATDYTIEVHMPSNWDITDRNYAIKRDAYSFESDYSAVVQP